MRTHAHERALPGVLAQVERGEHAERHHRRTTSGRPSSRCRRSPGRCRPRCSTRAARRRGTPRAGRRRAPSLPPACPCAFGAQRAHDVAERDLLARAVGGRHHQRARRRARSRSARRARSASASYSRLARGRARASIAASRRRASAAGGASSSSRRSASRSCSISWLTSPIGAALERRGSPRARRASCACSAREARARRLGAAAPARGRRGAARPCGRRSCPTRGARARPRRPGGAAPTICRLVDPAEVGAGEVAVAEAQLDARRAARRPGSAGGAASRRVHLAEQRACRRRASTLEQRRFGQKKRPPVRSRSARAGRGSAAG